VQPGEDAATENGGNDEGLVYAYITNQQVSAEKRGVARHESGQGGLITCHTSLSGSARRDIQYGVELGWAGLGWAGAGAGVGARRGWANHYWVDLDLHWDCLRIRSIGGGFFAMPYNTMTTIITMTMTLAMDVTMITKSRCAWSLCNQRGIRVTELYHLQRGVSTVPFGRSEVVTEH
jgi:hypothetical protein